MSMTHLAHGWHGLLTETVLAHSFELQDSKQYSVLQGCSTQLPMSHFHERECALKRTGFTFDRLESPFVPLFSA
jgi:hypothetical protein